MTTVALLPSAYPPAVGGVEELSRHLALALRDQGHTVEVWTGKQTATGPPVVERRDGLVVRRFAFSLPARAPGPLAHAAVRTPSTLMAMVRAARVLRPDMLHVQCFGPNGVYAAAAARVLRRPLVVTLQGETVMDDDDVFDHSVLLRRALPLALRQAAAVTGCSAFTLADAEERFGLAAGRGRVIFNGVGPLEGGGPDGSDDALADLPGSYILALGRVVEKKGFDLLIRAYATAVADLGSVDLVIGGSGPAEGALRSLADELGVGTRVHFPGRLSRQAVPAVMERAAAFVVPSRLEPFGIVVLEGWRSAVPVIATDRGGTPEFVHDGVDGLLVDPFDPAALAAALIRVTSDPALARTLAERGAERVADFSWPVIARRYEQLYREVLGRS